MNSRFNIIAVGWRAAVAGPLLAAAAVGACVVLVSCDQESAHSTTSTQPDALVLRIASLSPAMSRTLVDLDLAAFIVGRTPYCTSLDQSIPVVGDLLAVNYERLVRLNPTHILMQPAAKGIDPHLLEVAKDHGWAIVDWRLNGIGDITRMMEGIPGRLFGQSKSIEVARQRAAVSSRLVEWRRSLHTAIEPLTGQSRFEGDVLMVNAINPVMAFGRGTYLDDVLTALGGTNAVVDAGWVQLSLEDIVRLAPKAIILVKPGAAGSELNVDLGSLATMDVPAVQDQRLALLSHPDALLPSSAVVDVARDLRSILQRFAAAGSPADNRP